jgi:hypothetical protein
MGLGGRFFAGAGPNGTVINRKNLRPGSSADGQKSRTLWEVVFPNRIFSAFPAGHNMISYAGVGSDMPRSLLVEWD